MRRLILRQSFVVFVLTLSPLLLRGALDSLRQVVLEEVRVFGNGNQSFVSEKPHRKNFKGLRVIEPSQLAVVFDDPVLITKRLSQISVCFTDNQPKNYIFHLAFFSVGKNGQPSSLIKSRELILMRHKSGWQDFRLDSENVVIPSGGIAIIFYWMPQHKFSGSAVSRIGMGKYQKSPAFFSRMSDEENWVPVYTFFEGQNIAPMLQLRVEGN